MGITHVWYTGVIEHATMTDYSRFGIKPDDADVVKGRAGSPYAIKDYYDVNPDLAEDVPNRMREFEALVQRTHAKGLKVLVDFVPNHVARQYHSDAKPAGVKDLGETDDKTKSFAPNNNFYYLPGTSFVVPREYRPLEDLPHPTKDGRFDESPAKAPATTSLPTPRASTSGSRR
jgi:glycosidase